jgi:hypothetical protein
MSLKIGAHVSVKFGNQLTSAGGAKDCHIRRKKGQPQEFTLFLEIKKEFSHSPQK